jgi:hypothetical protein
MFSEKFKHRFEIFITYFGIGLFIVHFTLIMAIQFGLISGQYFPENLFGHPFASLFSPFSILLIYEVYLLIYYLRKSYTKSVAKQLEIMALILLRNSFKDIGKMMQGEIPIIQSDLIKDLSGFILVLLLLWAFYAIESARKAVTYELTPNFIRLKNNLSTLLIWIFLGLSLYSFSHWLFELIKFSDNHASLEDPSHVFYREFFTLLTFADVLLLLSSAKNLQNTILVIRNSGYVLATLLMRISFGFDGWERIFTIVLGACVAVFMLWISERSAFKNSRMSA